MYIYIAGARRVCVILQSLHSCDAVITLPLQSYSTQGRPQLSWNWLWME